MMNSKRGKFIVFEGIDGCGKTTQLELIAKKCNIHDIKISTTMEPTSTTLGNMIRNEYMNGYRYSDHNLLTMLLAADRYSHINDPDKGILKMMDAGVNILCDYYVMGGVVRQSLMEYPDADKFWNAFRFAIDSNRINMNRLMPDATIYIDVPENIAYERLCARSAEKKLSIFEKSDNFNSMGGIYKIAISILSNKFGDHVYVVDGTKPVNEVTDVIWKIVYPLLK